MTQQQSVQPLRSVEQLLAEYLDLQDQASQINERMAGIKAQIGDQVGVGGSLDINGVQVSVREPSRRFNLERAKDFLTDDQLALSLSVDATKVKKFLSPVLLEQCMEAGTGASVVTIR